MTPSRATVGVALLACTLGACSEGSAPAPAPTPTPAPAPEPASAPEPAPEPAPDPAVEPSTTPPEAPSADAIARCVWYADSTAPPTAGLGSLVDLDARIASAQPDRRARVIGRVRLAARGCPSLSVGVALLARADDAADDELVFPIEGALDAPVAGQRGDERRVPPWTADGIASGTTTCEETQLPTLVMFRATHARDGSVEALAFLPLGEICTYLGHDLSFGELDGDGSTEVRLRVRTSGVMDMSAGRDRSETLRIVDLAAWRTQLELEVATLEDTEVEGYGGRTREGDITLRDLDADGDRDIVFTHRDEDRMRSEDDSEEESFRSSAHEAFAYDPTADTYTRAPHLDP